MPINEPVIKKYNKIGVIADDLTGANDSGVQFAKKGYQSTVLFDDYITSNSEGAVVFNTNSRALAPLNAYNKCMEATENLIKLGCNEFYKKIDSTLRGNIASEIKGITDVLNPDFIIVAPAFPRNGRTTVNGHHYLNGIRVADTDLANDPITPVLESYIPNILSGEDDLKFSTEVITLDTLRNDDSDWSVLLKEKQKTGNHCLVFDAETDNDLKRVVEKLNIHEYSYLWVGSAGMAEHFPEKADSQVSKNHFKNHTHSLVVSGSLSPVTIEQVDELLKLPATKGVMFNPLKIYDEDIDLYHMLLVKDVLYYLKQQYDVVLYSDYGSDIYDRTLEKGLAYGYSRLEISQHVIEQMGQITKEVIKFSRIPHLVLTGGDTAMEVISGLGASGMELLDEIEPGIPLSRLNANQDYFVVTKSGSFGKKDSLINAVKMLKGEKNDAT